MKRLYITTLLSMLLSSCTNYIKVEDSAQNIRLYFTSDKTLIIPTNCEVLGEVIGTEGHWYSYLFFSNEHLTLGALNDLKNKAHALGANALKVHDDIDFKSSVTFFGQALKCEE